MFDNLRNIIMGILCVSLIGLWFIDSLRLKSDNAKILGCESAISEQNSAIKVQAAAALEQLIKQQEVENNAAAQEKQNIKDVNLILKTRVPADCNSAIQWGISEAKKVGAS